MKRISLILAAALSIAPFCAAQNYPPADLSNFRQEGIASWYGAEFNGRPTASGEIFNSSLYTAAHPTLPFGTLLTVTNLNNGRKVNVRVNDRGPFVSSRIIDLSHAAALMLDMVKEGTAPVLVETMNSSGQAGDTGYRAETNSYARSEGGASSANSQVVAPPYPVYQSQDPVVIQPQNPAAAAPPQQQITQYFQQPVQPVQPAPRQPVQQPWYPQQPPQQAQPPIQQVQPVQQVLPVQQVQPPVQQTAPPQSPQTVQPLQIQIPIEIKPIISAEPAAQPPAAGSPAAGQPGPAPSSPAASASAPAAAPAISPAAPPAAVSTVTVILSPETPPAPVPPIQVRVKPNTIYRVQIGSFKEARNALAAFERLKEAGLSPVYERNGDFFRVVLSGIPSEEMAAILQKVQTAGFTDPLLREER